MLPILYLRGLSTGDFAPALTEFFGADTGLSASSIGRLLETWGTEYNAFENRDLSGSDFVYVWADGVHFYGYLQHQAYSFPAGYYRRNPLLRFGRVRRPLIRILSSTTIGHSSLVADEIYEVSEGS